MEKQTTVNHTFNCVTFVSIYKYTHLRHVTIAVCQFVGDDAGIISVGPEGRPRSVSSILSQFGSAPQAVTGLPVC